MLICVCMSVLMFVIMYACVYVTDHSSGPCCIFRVTERLHHDASPVLETLCGLALVRNISEVQFQITDMGLDSLTVERKMQDMQPALKPRAGVELCDRTVWEMLVILMEQGWRALPFAGSLWHVCVCCVLKCLCVMCSLRTCAL
jgi:hypothetical protein